MNKLDDLKGILATDEAHLIGIVETKAKNGGIPPKECLEINSYDLFLSPHYNDADTRGALIYAKSTLNATLVDTEESKRFKDCVWVRVPSKDGDILFGCIYRSGSPNKAIPLDKDLNMMIKNMTLHSGYKCVVIMGDFNFPQISWTPNPVIVTQHQRLNHPENLFVNTITEAMLNQHVKLPTRDSRIEGHRSTKDDLIFSTDIDMVYNLDHIGHLGASDHQILSFTTYNTFKPCQRKISSRFKYWQTDENKFTEEMDKNWQKEFENKNPDEAYNIFLQHYTKARDNCIPKETITKSNRFIKPIWMKHATMNLIKRKRRFHIKFLNTRNQADKERYNLTRNEVTAALRRDRLCFERGISKEIKNNNKVFWRYVNSQRASKSSIPDLERPDGTKASTDEEKAEILNQQFTSVFTKEDMDNIPEFNPHPCTSFLENINIKPSEVKKKLSKLRTDKSCGPDEVHPYILNHLADCMSIPLAFIFNMSIKSGMVPKIWKEGIVTALFKKGKKSLASNYRPITLTSIVCKVLEKIMVEHLIKHLKSNNLEDESQHGFTPKKSTTTNLLQALNIWSESISHGLPVDVLYLDLEKAFDKVPHHRLICQLQKFGIRGQILNWIKDYLHNRYQRVRINGALSSRSMVLSGVPQGSVLGPALFLLFVADVAPLVNNFVTLYADDSKLFNSIYENNTSDESIQSIQNDINTLSLWADNMQMSFNVDKCHALHLGHNNKNHVYTLPKMSNIKKGTDHTSYTYTFHNLKNVDEEKDLGVIMDNDLNFKSHISHKISKANSMIYLIKNCFKYLDAEMFKTLYKSLIRPHLEYASPIWSPTAKGEILRLEGVQRRATKLVPGISTLSYNDRLKHLQLPTLEYRRIRQDLLLLYNYIHQNIILDTSTHCTICNTQHMLTPITSGTRGHPYRYSIHRHNNIRKRFYSTRTIPLWNQLDESTVLAPTLNQFKNKLSKDASMPSPYIFTGNTTNN